MSSVLKFFPVKITALLEDSAGKLILFFRESVTRFLLELQKYPIHYIGFLLERLIQFVEPPPEAEYPVILQAMVNVSSGFTGGRSSSMQKRPTNNK